MKAFFLAFSLAALGLAQSTDAVLSGQVNDPSGATIPGAELTARNLKTGVSTRTTANESGVYLFAALQPGTYQLTAEHRGFKKHILDQVPLEVGSRLTLNIRLEIGTSAEVVEVLATTETVMGLTSSSVGGVITGQQLVDLPLGGRNALNLVTLHAGVVGDTVSGARIGTLNITVDGINVQDNRINIGISSPIFTSVDRIEEVRVITSPADAEFRGSGQIQFVTRGGTNQFHGGLFHQHRNTVLNANTWFNNQRGRDPETGLPISPRNDLIFNQYGGRLGGPIRTNRTFFNFSFEGQRIRQKGAVTTTVWTDNARRGIFRFFPGVQNANAIAAAPTVDLAGAPVRPATATGALQAVSLFARDPNRIQPDRTGLLQRFIDQMPLPNNFRFGDGLNTAGYTWRRRSSNNFEKFSVRIDHNFNSTHRATFSYDYEKGAQPNGFLAQQYPNGQGGDVKSRDSLFSLGVTSTLRSNLLNELRLGALRPRLRFNAPWELAGTEFLPRVGTQPFVPDFGTVTDLIDVSNDPQGRITPVYVYSDSLTWLKGKHAFKAGGELRFASTNGFNSFDVMPRAVIGTGGTPFQNINTIPGIAQNLTGAQNLLNDLTGTLGSLVQALNSPGGANPAFLAGEGKQRVWKSREYGFFFKDDYKVTAALTLNLGVRYDWFSVPWDGNGRAVALVGGSQSIFGLSGTTFGDIFQPGRSAGSLTQFELVGGRSPNPDRKIYGDDFNNFAPAVGLAWKLPWLGREMTVLRIGYGIGYERDSLRQVDVLAGDQPGLRERRVFTTANYLSLANMQLPLTALDKPLSLVPLTDRVQTARTYDSGLRTAYVQNWNFSIQRSLTRNLTLDVRYVGNKGTGLLRGADVNEMNVFENGILDAFLITQQGGHAPLFDRIFQGINLAGRGVVDGRTVTGSDLLRVNSTTQAYFVSGNVGTLANFLSNTDQYTNVRGGLLRRAGLPENWVMANPQFASARYTGNVANSTYHSMQVEVIRRFSAGWTFQGNYTWSRALGEEEGSGQELLDSYRTQRNRSLDKRLLGSHRTHVFRNNGTWNLPFGPGRRLLGGRGGVVSRLVENWQMGFIFNLLSGAPIGFGSGVASFNGFTDNTPVALAALANSAGNLRKTGNSVVYFDEYSQIPDPGIARITDREGIRGRSTLKAITDSAGNILMVNPVPGQLGTMSQRFVEGPGSFGLDFNLIKRLKVTETVQLELRLDAINAANSPQFNNPTTDINSTTFGRITGAGGSRILYLGTRINF